MMRHLGLSPLWLIPLIFLLSSCGYKNAEECIAEHSKASKNKAEIANVVKYCESEFPKKKK
jgi:hypothetical protein